jgi:beta-galactosidase/beta-glucuronidase
VLLVENNRSRFPATVTGVLVRQIRYKTMISRFGLLGAIFALLSISALAWTAVENRLTTRFANDIDPNLPLPDYPRPQLVRSQWSNLNGIWSCAITQRDAAEPDQFPNQILVPFPIESSLSGIGQSVGPDHVVWYRRTFSTPVLRSGERLILNFGAVNWEATVYINGHLAGTRRGGYDPFSFDISSLLQPGLVQTLVLRVYAPASGPIPRGKQSLKPSKIFYTASSGIWQTVWTEIVPEFHVTNIEIVPDINQECVFIGVQGSGPSGQPISAEVVDDQGKIVGCQSGSAEDKLRVRLPQAKLWSPDQPYLYTLRLQYAKDSAESYFGMRSVAVAKDSAGVNRFFLNGRQCFMFGLLDQGYWPDGLYTAPSDRALRYDLEMTKACGFNTIRKHVKVEPSRWYYWADKLGILVWQDFPAVTDVLVPKYADDVARSPDVAGEIEAEMHAMVQTLVNHPCVIGWIPFNEGWGQFDTIRIASLFKSWDPSRLVDDASGWNDRRVGDVFDLHSYPYPSEPSLKKDRISFQGEYGGGGLLVKDHDWNSGSSYQYAHFDTPEQLLLFFTEGADILRQYKKSGLAGAIYTQTTDVENEINGLMTYDRVPKIDPPNLKPIVTRTISNP